MNQRGPQYSGAGLLDEQTLGIDHIMVVFQRFSSSVTTDHQQSCDAASALVGARIHESIRHLGRPLEGRTLIIPFKYKVIEANYDPDDGPDGDVEATESMRDDHAMLPLRPMMRGPASSKREKGVSEGHGRRELTNVSDQRSDKAQEMANNPGR
ncbi:MAG: hypothetical protein CMP47_12895 [Rickettsiales bacterium]|nr:hypothetical protein [Rickettsiales bacterium]